MAKGRREARKRRRRLFDIIAVLALVITVALALWVAFLQ
jgi:hypothetical protein